MPPRRVPPPAGDQGAAPAPIFIVGCHRSGTTLLRLMLDSHPNISCGPETGFLTDFVRLTRDPAWSHLRQYGFPKEYWHGKIAELFDSFQRDYAQARGKVRWAEKTPKYALHLEYINELFPDCQVVHIIRDGRDVVASHLDRWGLVSAVKATRKWPLYVQAVRTAAARLPASRYVEVRYEDLVTETETTLRKLLDFLGEPWDDVLLKYDQQPHDVQPRYLAFSSGRRAAAGDPTASVYRSRVGAHRRGLNPLRWLLFRLVPGRTLRELGYR